MMPKKWSGKKLKAIREKRFPSQAAAARAVGVEARNFLKWEKGEKVPGYDTAAKIASVMGVGMEELGE